MSEAAAAHEERFEFQAEIKQLLHLLVFSLYTKREIFIRELVSNASDALDKMRYLLLSSGEEAGKEIPLEIRIDLDTNHKILSISDTGIGMTRAELVQNLGTIARSGSMEFLKRLGKDKRDDLNLIGQFGVGFYSVFMVASEVRVLTKSHRPDEPGQMWVSDGTGSYTIRDIDLPRRGTKIEIQLKSDAAEFAEKTRVEGVIKRYSNFVPYPIFIDGRQANETTAPWTKPKADLTPEEYEEFYKYLTNAFDGPAATIHLTSDAPLSFKSILFLPKMNLERFGMGKLEHGPDLYARKVLIQHNCKDLVPDYLRFVRGVVDSEDITLNVSRETIQDNLVLQKIRKFITKKILEHMADMLKNRRDDYIAFYREFGRILKEGVTVDPDNREKLAKLLLFNASSCAREDELVTLEQYVERMVEGQQAIYYLAGPDRSSLDASPHLEMFRKKGIDVLYLYDPVDDFVLDQIDKFDGKPLRSADQVPAGELKAIKSADTEKEPEAKEETFAFQSGFDALLKKFKEVLGERVLDVKASERLATSPCLLVTPEGGPSIQIQKVMQMMDKNFQMTRRVLEVNKDNPIIRNLVELNGQESNAALVSDFCEQLFENAMLAEGIIPEPSKMVSRMQRILERASAPSARA